jgi:hypothetical protein
LKVGGIKLANTNLSKSAVRAREQANFSGVVTGFLATLAIGFVIYFTLNSIQVTGSWFPYDKVVANADKNIFYKLIWAIMNFTEAEFYAGVLASLGIILGGFVAWRLDVKKSKWAGFNVCYGTNTWPWVFASQALSVGIAIFVLNYTNAFNNGEYTWIPTFITIVAAPAAVILIYGPSFRALFTGSILGAVISFPVAFWIMTKIIPVLEVPGVVSNVFTMALTNIIVLEVCRALPWMKKTPMKPIISDAPQLSKEEQIKQMSNPTWFIRRVLADFTEAQFYGNEIAGAFVIIGASLDWILNMKHGAYASGVVPAIILSQFIGSAVGVLLYFKKYVEGGWYATFVPVVSVGPACVLMFGGTIPVALFAGVLGGIIGAPFADYLVKKLPDGLHPTIGNVTSMGVCTIIVSVVMKALPWF